MANTVKKNKISTNKKKNVGNITLSRRKYTTRTLTKIAILGALAAVVMLLEFPLWFAPPFYEMNFSEVIVLIGAFSMGPWCGVAIEAIKIIINTMFNSTDTMFVGEVANFIMGCAFIVPAALIYKNYKSVKTAITGMMAGTLCMATVGVALNYWVLLPIFAWAYNMPLQAIIDMGTAINENIKDLFTFVLFATAPFNFLKGVLSSIVTLILYKRVSPILHK